MVKPLERIALGNTGLVTSRLALGTVKFGRATGVRYPTPVSIPSDAEAKALLKQAQDLGINLIDTAPAYGSSEERLGSLLKGQQADWLICTKVGEEFDGERSQHDFSAEHCRMSVERSLRRLGVEQLDIVLIHSDGNDLRILNEFGTLEALQTLKQQGLVGQVGISHKTAAGAARALELGADVLMATLNRSFADDVDIIARAAQQGCGVLIKKALESGYGNSADLAYVAEHEGVHSIVVGTTNPRHLEDNVSAISRFESALQSPT